jgi:hypothetical protein
VVQTDLAEKKKKRKRNRFFFFWNSIVFVRKKDVFLANRGQQIAVP